ncbi:MAG: hypothetical protein H0W40_19535 [Methylibium sp.]|uniref:hypothetical protein n=1 Tax=Methylibium sp. TaxID=2067992 RepID=UPI00182E1D42|nr:hypothetical protein [Methylibium sp.]MBA3599537.1 hypothetical protein [Methylibium sp.]
MFSDEVLVQHLREGLSATQICKRLKVAWGSGIKHRLDRLREDGGIPLVNGRGHGNVPLDAIQTEQRINEYMAAEGRQHFKLNDGVLLVASDAHYWPGIVSTAHRAFVKFAREMKPSCLVMNGDGFDGAKISRYPRIGWDKRPSVLDELKAVKERLTEIEEACGTKNLFWPLGNHDARFETFLAAHASEYEGVTGFHLRDHFPLWRPCWSLWLNDSVVVKHRYKGGIHAAHTNTASAGKTMVTGHLHSLKVTPLSDYNGTRYGVDTGTLAAPYGPQFSDYTEDAPTNWRAGFAVLTFWRGTLLWPELCHVLDEEQGIIEFRGTVLKV